MSPTWIKMMSPSLLNLTDFFSNMVVDAVQCLDPNELDGSLIGIKKILVEGCKTLCSFEESHLKKLSRTPVWSNSLSRSKVPLFYA